MARFRIGVVGCGAISAAYLVNAKKHENLEIVACADVVPEAAERRAKEFGIPRVLSVQSLMKDDAIDCVLNLTIPLVHGEIALQALESGKHVYNEKPLAIERGHGQKLLAIANERKLQIGCAPDTFLGAGHQTARKQIDDGAIGKPVAAMALMLSRGHEGWHPNPDFYYQPGGGPMFDMGPYYLTSLINLLGPIRRVSGAASVAIPERTITHKDIAGNPGPKFGQKIKVNTPDHIAGTIEFAGGAIASIVTSFAVQQANYDRAHPITIFGTEGTLLAPDPNGFDGDVQLWPRGDEKPHEVAMTHATGYQRSAGVADLAEAIGADRPARAGGTLALAVLDAMQGFLESSRDGKAIDLVTEHERPAAMPAGSAFGAFTV